MSEKQNCKGCVWYQECKDQILDECVLEEFSSSLSERCVECGEELDDWGECPACERREMWDDGYF